MKNVAKSLIGLVIISLTITNLQAQFQGGENVRITETQDDDLYVAGSSVEIDAEIRGDLIAAGSSININEAVMGDLLIAGGTLRISGKAGDDVRAAGGWVIVDSDIEDDLVVFAGNVIVSEGVNIGGNLVFFGGGLDFKGNVKGDVKAIGGEIDIKGDIEGAFSAYAERLSLDGNITGDTEVAAEYIELGSEASFSGDIRYWSEEEVDFSGASQGVATFDEDLKRDEFSWQDLGGGMVMFWIIYLIAMAILIIVLQYLFPKPLKNASDVISKDIVKSLVYGLLYFVVTPIVAFLMILIIIGIPLGVTILVLFGLSLFLGASIASVVIANYVNDKYNRNLSAVGLTGIAILCFILIQVIGMIPIAGWILKLLLTAIVFGGLISTLRKPKDPAVT